MHRPCPPQLLGATIAAAGMHGHTPASKDVLITTPLRLVHALKSGAGSALAGLDLALQGRWICLKCGTLYWMKLIGSLIWASWNKSFCCCWHPLIHSPG
jgi:hypothetical protein